MAGDLEREAGLRLAAHGDVRAPLVEAARNGRLEVVGMLLEVYGDQIKCDLAEEGRASRNSRSTSMSSAA